jgi:hypothetical protein
MDTINIFSKKKNHKQNNFMDNVFLLLFIFLFHDKQIHKRQKHSNW